MKVLNSKPPRFLLCLACILFLLTYIACEPDYGNLLTSHQDLPPLVFAFLNTAADSQYVILQNPIPLSGITAEFLKKEYELYRQAAVTLTDETGDFAFDDKYEIVPVREDPYYLVLVSAQRVQPGVNYRLRVEIPQKGVYTASTAAPNEFQILSPHALDTLDVFNPLIVRWTASEGAAGYRVGLLWKAGRRYVYVEPSAERVRIIEHNFEVYYKSPGADPRQILGDDATIFVEALDTPAWLAYEINQRGGYAFGGPDEVRAMPGDYSNIQNGRGIMSATTTITIPLILPPRKQ